MHSTTRSPSANRVVLQPKAWNELQAGIDCLTQLVLLIQAMASSPVPSEVDVADVLQQQLIYNGEVLDIAFDSIRAYKEGTQSLAYLDSSVHLAYALFRMLEVWGKKRGGRSEMYVRRKEKARRRKRGVCGVRHAMFDVLTRPTRHREGRRRRPG